MGFTLFKIAYTDVHIKTDLKQPWNLIQLGQALGQGFYCYMFISDFDLALIEGLMPAKREGLCTNVYTYRTILNYDCNKISAYHTAFGDRDICM